MNGRFSGGLSSWGARRVLEVTGVSQFSGVSLESIEVLEVVAEDEARRMFAISSIATPKSLKSSAISAPVAP